MKTLHLLILVTGITFIVTAGLFFTLSSFSIGTVSQSNKMQESVSNYSYDMQNAVYVTSVIRRTIEPEKVCFTADDNFLSQYPSISKAIPESDKYALQNQTIHAEPLGKYYNGEGVDLSKDQIVTLLSNYDFNHTTTYDEDEQHTFKFRNEYFTCGFQHGTNNYDLFLKYSKLVETENNLGYVPITISDTMTSNPQDVVYGGFNNTLVFNNTLGTKVALMITSDANLPDLQVTIPPRELYFLYLNENVTHPVDVTYHYKIDKFPKVDGTVIVKRVSNCLSQEITKSLYLQNDFMIKFPTYLPDGFIPVCNEPSIENIAIERFANSTGIAQNKNLHFYHISANQDKDSGIIGVRAIIQYGKNTTDSAYQDYKNDISIAYDDSTFSRYGDGSITTYVAPGGVSTVVFTTKDQIYTFTGKIPLDELIKMAKSMS